MQLRVRTIQSVNSIVDLGLTLVLTILSVLVPMTLYLFLFVINEYRCYYAITVTNVK